MTRRRDLMCEDLTGCSHEPETPVLAENGVDIDHWICRCGKRAATGQTNVALLEEDERKT